MSLDLQHIVATANLLRAAGNRGVFKLEQYEKVFAGFSECVRVVREVSQEKKELESVVNPQGIALVLDILVHAANNNGFDIADYGNVNVLKAQFQAYLKEKAQEEGGEEEKKVAEK